MINEILIKSFLEVARTLNFTTAANNLYVTQQAVSKHISALEADLRLLLFNRNANHTVTLTPEGAELARLLLSFDIQFSETLKNLHERTRINNNHINIGIQSMHHVGDIPAQVIMTLGKKYSKFKVTAEMHSAGTLIRRLNDGILDFITISDIYLHNPRKYNTVKLIKSPVYLAVSKQLISKTKKKSFEKFCTLPLLITDSDYQVALENNNIRFYEKYNFRPSSVVVRPNWDAVYVNLEMGNGVSIATDQNSFVGLNVELFDSGFTSYLIGVWRRDALSPAAGIYAKETKKAFEKVGESHTE